MPRTQGIRQRRGARFRPYLERAEFVHLDGDFDSGADLGEAFEQPAVAEGPDLLGESADAGAGENLSPLEYSPRDELAAVEEGDFPSERHSYAIDTAPDQSVTVHGSGRDDLFKQLDSPEIQPTSVPPEGWTPGRIEGG